jgi:putative ABC transport system substrate-binding protein
MMKKANAYAQLLSLLAILTLVLAGCGPGGEGPTQVPSAATPTTAAGGSTPTTAAGRTATPGAAKKYRVGILQFATHPALDFTREGIKAAFVDNNLKEGTDVEFDIRNAEGDVPTARTIAQKFVSDKVDIILTIGSPATDQAKAATADSMNIPVVFCAVADPYIAGFAGTQDGENINRDPAVHPDNLTGVQAFPPVQAGLELIQEVLPGAKRIGLLWNPNEPNSLATTLEVRKVTAELGLNVVEAPVPNPAASAAAAASFANKGIDAFFVSTTNSVVAGLDAVVSEARRTKKPLFGNDPLSAVRGAVAAQGLDYTENGRQAGDMAVRILTGRANVKTMPVERTTKESLCVNTAAAADQGVTLPQTLLDRAKGCTYDKITSPVPPTAGPGGGTPGATGTITGTGTMTTTGTPAP